MLATVATKSGAVAESTALHSILTPTVDLMAGDPTLKGSEVIATVPSSMTDTRMKVDSRDPAEPDSNEGTEGIDQVRSV